MTTFTLYKLLYFNLKKTLPVHFVSKPPDPCDMNNKHKARSILTER